MIVCICKNVNERAIREAIEDGARTVAGVGRATGAGTGCGACRCAIAGLVALHAPKVLARAAAPTLVAVNGPAAGKAEPAPRREVVGRPSGLRASRG